MNSYSIIGKILENHGEVYLDAYKLSIV